MAEKLYLFARGSPTRGNNDESKALRMLGAATRVVALRRRDGEV